MVVLPREHRLTEAADFRAAARRGGRSGGRLLVVHTFPRAGMPARTGFVVGKSVGNAVVRNRVRRRLRHLVAERLTTLSTADRVVRALPAAADASYQELGGELDRCLHRSEAMSRG